MELPTKVLVHNEILNIKGSGADLLSISDHGYYEVNLKFGQNVHRVLLPIAATVVINQEPEVTAEERIEVER